MTSQGMVLAADTGTRVEVLSYSDTVPPGAFVDLGGSDSPIISYSVFESNPLVVGTVTGADERHLRVDIGDRSLDVDGHWPIGSRVVVQLDGPGGSRGRVIHFASGELVVPGTDLPAGTRVR